MDDDSRRRYSGSIEQTRSGTGRVGLATSDWLQRSVSQHPENHDSKWKDLRRGTATRPSHERMHHLNAGWRSGRGEGCAAEAPLSGGRWREVDKGLQCWRTDQGEGHCDGLILILKSDLANVNVV